MSEWQTILTFFFDPQPFLQNCLELVAPAPLARIVKSPCASIENFASKQHCLTNKSNRKWQTLKSNL